MTAMRVYLGGDHAGYEVKRPSSPTWKTGHEPIDCGAFRVRRGRRLSGVLHPAAASRHGRRPGQPEDRSGRLEGMASR